MMGILAGIVSVLMPVAMMSTAGGSTPAASASSRISDSGYTSSAVCGTCHVDIYRSWKRSMHAYSLSDPIFEVAFMQAIKEQPSARELCLGCHAPVTLLNRDYELTLDITLEGVTCDFCHTVTEAHIGDRNAPYTQELGRVKRSTMKRVESSAHEVAYSELHATAEFCGACHQYSTENGTEVMGTYNEWLAGPYSKEGIICQDCHMSAVADSVVDQTVNAASVKRISRHDLIHDAYQLKTALKVRVADLVHEESSLVVHVDVVNVGSGHMVPTGVPNREVLLRVTVKRRNGSVLRQEKSYRKILAGADRQPLTSDYQAFLYAESILSDNRLKPLEPRREIFRFAVPSGESVGVTAVALYRYAPPIINPTSMVVTMAADSLVSQGRRSRSPR